MHMHTFSYICIRYKIQMYIYKLIWFRTGLFKARFASHLVQNGASKRVSRVIWFRTGIQSAFRESFGSERGFKARFVSHLIQNGALQSSFRD